MGRTIGQVIKTARAESDMSREKLAAKLKISAGYLGHLECDNHVRLSDRVTKALRKFLKLKSTQLTDRLVETHNKKSAKYRRDRLSHAG